MVEYNVFGEGERMDRYDRYLKPEEEAGEEFNRFKKWSEGVVLFLHNTSRVETDKHQKLLGKKGGGGFPYLVVLDSNGDVLTKIPGKDRTVDGFTEAVSAAKETKARIADLRKKAEEGNTAKKKLFSIQLELGHLTLKQAKNILSTLNLTAEERKEFDSKCAGLELNEIMASEMMGNYTHQTLYLNGRSQKRVSMRTLCKQFPILPEVQSDIFTHSNVQ